MIRFKEFITEVKTAALLSRRATPFIKSILPYEGNKYDPNHTGAEHIGTVNGHHIYRHKKLSGAPSNTVTYSAYNPKTRKSTVAVRGKENAHGVLSDLNLAASQGNQLHAHELYHHLLHHGHVTALVADHQSAGGKKVWERLSKKSNIGIHGWDPRKNKPVNIKFGEDDTHEEKPKVPVNGNPNSKANKKKYDALNPDPTVKSMQLVAHKK
jgi:hypothetical protein